MTDLTALLADPASAAGVPPEDAVAILGHIADQEAALRALRSALQKGVSLWSPALRRSAGVPLVPDFNSLPRISHGSHAGERLMTVRQFAGWCGQSAKTVRGWLYERQVIPHEKRGTKRQSRIVIASGERERRLTRVHGRRLRSA